MHLLDIATAQPCLQKNVYALRSQTPFYKKFVCGHEKRLPHSWKSFCVPEKDKSFNSGRIRVSRCGLVIEAVAILECTQAAKGMKEQSHYQNLSMDNDSSSSTSSSTAQSASMEDSAALDDREKLRRMRISKANKGNTPWNKGKRHSPATLQRIRERTRLAMQNPKVKMKLVNLGHAQSEETRVKIGVGVRIGWEKRRQKLMLQETCYYEWQNLIAEASRKGLLGEDELQWDSYRILNEQLEQEWLQSVEQRKKMPRLKGSKRAPKSHEQRRKIAEAIAAKWADPDYRNRVCSALAKYHGIPEGVERKRRRKPSLNGETRKRNPPKQKVQDADEFLKLKTKSQIQRIKLKRRKGPLFQDPLASSKLEMLKNIRAQRAASENKKTEAIARAKALIAEAEKAAKALEAAAEKSQLAQTCLVETRKLIAEATLSIESIDRVELNSDEIDRSSVLTSRDPETNFKNEVDSATESLNQTDYRKVNGTAVAGASISNAKNLDFNEFTLPNMMNGSGYEVPPLNSKNHDLPNGKEILSLKSSSDFDLSPEEVKNVVKISNFTGHLGDPEPDGSEQSTDSELPNGMKGQSETGNPPPKSVITTKKWVRGRLVEGG